MKIRHRCRRHYGDINESFTSSHHEIFDFIKTLGKVVYDIAYFWGAIMVILVTIIIVDILCLIVLPIMIILLIIVSIKRYLASK